MKKQNRKWEIYTPIYPDREEEILKPITDEIEKLVGINSRGLLEGISNHFKARSTTGVGNEPIVDQKLKCHCVNHKPPTGVCVFGACLGIKKWCLVTVDGVPTYLPCQAQITIQL